MKLTVVRDNELGRSPTSRGPVVAVLPRGEAIKNFVYTGALEAWPSVCRCAWSRC